MFNDSDSEEDVEPNKNTYSFNDLLKGGKNLVKGKIFICNIDFFKMKGTHKSMNTSKIGELSHYMQIKMTNYELNGENATML
jgi:hypothetical protein